MSAIRKRGIRKYADIFCDNYPEWEKPKATAQCAYQANNGDRGSFLMMLFSFFIMSAGYMIRNLMVATLAIFSFLATLVAMICVVA